MRKVTFINRKNCYLLVASRKSGKEISSKSKSKKYLNAFERSIIKFREKYYYTTNKYKTNMSIVKEIQSILFLKCTSQNFTIDFLEKKFSQLSTSPLIFRTTISITFCVISSFSLFLKSLERLRWK